MTRNPDQSGMRNALCYHPDEQRRDASDWRDLLHGPVKTRPLTSDEMSKLEAKREALDFLTMLDLSVRECARLIRRDESDVRHWLDVRRLDREVPASFYSRVYCAVGPRAIAAWQMVHAAWIRGDGLDTSATG